MTDTYRRATDPGAGETVTEWGVRYEIPDPEPLHSATRTQVVASEQIARVAVANGAPIRATNRRVVSRTVTEWQPVDPEETA